MRVMGVLDVVGDGERRMSQTSEGLCVGESDGMHAFVRHTRTSVVGSYSAVSTACPSSAATRALLPTVELPSTTTRDTRGMAQEGGKKCRGKNENRQTLTKERTHTVDGPLLGVGWRSSTARLVSTFGRFSFVCGRGLLTCGEKTH